MPYPGRHFCLAAGTQLHAERRLMRPLVVPIDRASLPGCSKRLLLVELVSASARTHLWLPRGGSRRTRRWRGDGARWHRTDPAQRCDRYRPMPPENDLSDTRPRSEKGNREQRKVVLRRTNWGAKELPSLPCWRPAKPDHARPDGARFVST